MFAFEAQTLIKVRDQATGQPELFRVVCAGACCVSCAKCGHQCMVTPSTRNTLCTHCDEHIAIPLGAHFACPARLQSQFAVVEPFDIEHFLAHEGPELRRLQQQSSEKLNHWGGNNNAVSPATDILVGFADIDVIDNGESEPVPGGLWSALGRAWAGIKGGLARSQHVLAVLTGASMCWYVVHTSVQTGLTRYERIFEQRLAESRISVIRRGTAWQFRLSSWQGAVQMDLGSSDVGQIWLQALSPQCAGVYGVQGSGADDRSLFVDADNSGSTGRSHTAVRLVPA
ncbi:hypothetical protein GGF46_001310 [Coemansia sp. RSA 552]|nr:hypothetical protein GGF46_001310 [Coemansia sp. RSA 552]